MWRPTKVLGGMGVALLAAVLVTFAFAADAPQQTRPESGRGGMQGGPGGFDREAMQERMMTMMKEQLGASDEEWTVIKPRLTEVMTLSQSINTGGGMRGMFGRGPGAGGPGGPGGAVGGAGGPGGRREQQQQNAGAAEPAATTDPVQKAINSLRSTLEKEAPSADEIKANLTALRTAREKAKLDMAKAQQKLREVLTLKQEAQLVMMGMLE